MKTIEEVLEWIEREALEKSRTLFAAKSMTLFVASLDQVLHERLIGQLSGALFSLLNLKSFITEEAQSWNENISHEPGDALEGLKRAVGKCQKIIDEEA